MDAEFVVGKVTVRNGQTAHTLADELVETVARVADETLSLLAERYLDRVKLPERVEVTLIDDETIARVHGEFMDDPTPTDVITFPYGEEGEILISVETASRHSQEFGVGFDRELVLYVVHGTLHLGGYKDHTSESQTEMNELQEQFVAELFEGR